MSENINEDDVKSFIMIYGYSFYEVITNKTTGEVLNDWWMDEFKKGDVE